MLEDYQENYQTGFIAIYRSLRNHWLWEDDKKLKWWLDLLLEVNHKERNVPIGTTNYLCKRGQSIKSLRNWAIRWRTTPKTVKSFLKMLELDKMITTESITVSTRITICNYGVYQFNSNDKETGITTQSNTQGKRKVNATSPPSPYKQEANNDNNENKGYRGELEILIDLATLNLRFEQKLMALRIPIARKTEATENAALRVVDLDKFQEGNEDKNIAAMILQVGYWWSNENKFASKPQQEGKIYKEFKP